MMKAANFNAIRACEHVECAEVRELQDRLGMMSEQDMVGFGDGCVPTADGGAGNASVSVAVPAFSTSCRFSLAASVTCNT